VFNIALELKANDDGDGNATSFILKSESSDYSDNSCLSTNN
jgi:hypothetical protein